MNSTIARCAASSQTCDTWGGMPNFQMYCLFTPYEELVYNGVFDDIIGGAENRGLAIVENDLMVTGLLERYQEAA